MNEEWLPDAPGVESLWTSVASTDVGVRTLNVRTIERSSQLDSVVTNGEAEDSALQADEEASSAAEPAGGEPRPSWWARQRALWLWGGLALVVAAVIGTSIGMSLATRPGGLLSNQGGGNARPTIVVGTVLAAPSASSSLATSTVVPVASVVAEGTPAPASEYVVQPGDSLQSIAQQQYGDAGQWPKIYQANRDVIGPDPDALVAGTKLQVPAR